VKKLQLDEISPLVHFKKSLEEFLLRNKQRKAAASASELNCINYAHFRPYVYCVFENILTGTRFNNYAFHRSNNDPIRPEGCTARENTKKYKNIYRRKGPRKRSFKNIEQNVNLIIGWYTCS
jgi:hypothetical protein